MDPQSIPIYKTTPNKMEQVLASTIVKSIPDISTITQYELVDHIADILMNVDSSYHCDVVWHIGYSILRSGTHPIADGTYSYLLTPTEIEPSPVFDTTEELLTYMKHIVEPKKLTYVSPKVILQEDEKVFDREDILIHYDGLTLKTTYTDIYIVLVITIVAILYALFTM